MSLLMIGLFFSCVYRNCKVSKNFRNEGLTSHKKAMRRTIVSKNPRLILDDEPRIGLLDEKGGKLCQPTLM